MKLAILPEVRIHTTLVHFYHFLPHLCGFSQMDIGRKCHLSFAQWENSNIEQTHFQMSVSVCGAFSLIPDFVQEKYREITDLTSFTSSWQEPFLDRQKFTAATVAWHLVVGVASWTSAHCAAKGDLPGRWVATPKRPPSPHPDLNLLPSRSRLFSFSVRNNFLICFSLLTFSNLILLCKRERRNK